MAYYVCNLLSRMLTASDLMARLWCGVVTVKVVNSSVGTISIDGLASGSHYRVHVQSISLSGVATSKPVLFETDSAAGHRTVWPITLTVISSFILLSAVIIVWCRLVLI